MKGQGKTRPVQEGLEQIKRDKQQSIPNILAIQKKTA
jgi:hypothetical protein